MAASRRQLHNVKVQNMAAATSRRPSSRSTHARLYCCLARFLGRRKQQGRSIAIGAIAKSLHHVALDSGCESDQCSRVCLIFYSVSYIDPTCIPSSVESLQQQFKHPVSGARHLFILDTHIDFDLCQFGYPRSEGERSGEGGRILIGESAVGKKEDDP